MDKHIQSDSEKLLEFAQILVSEIEYPEVDGNAAQWLVDSARDKIRNIANHITDQIIGSNNQGRFA
jgi:hypothetical protein